MTASSTAIRALTARPWLTAVILVVVAGAVAGYVLLTTGSGSSAAASATSQLVSVATGTVSESVSTTGDLEPADDEQVSFSSSATVTSVRVTTGQKIKKGQVLGTINSLASKATLAQDRSSLASARSTLADAQSDDDSTSAQLVADRAQVTTARQTVASARSAVADAVLRSPINGVVADVNVTRGDQSSGAGSSSSSSTTTGAGATTGTTGDTSTSTDTSSDSGDFEIIGMSKWKVSVDVDDTEIGLVAKGQQVQLTTDNHAGTLFGTVTSVSVLSSSDSGSASYPVVVSLTGDPSGLHDGAETTAKIIYKQATNVVTVPSRAVHRDASTSYVYLSSGGKKVKQTVTTGLTGGATTEIKSGLTAGEKVYEQTFTPGGATSGTPGGTQNSAGNQEPGGGAGGFPGGGSGGFPGGGGTGGFGGGS